jgi:hypothetical protein
MAGLLVTYMAKVGNSKVQNNAHSLVVAPAGGIVIGAAIDRK